MFFKNKTVWNTKKQKTECKSHSVVVKINILVVYPTFSDWASKLNKSFSTSINVSASPLLQAAFN